MKNTKTQKGRISWTYAIFARRTSKTQKACFAKKCTFRLGRISSFRDSLDLEKQYFCKSAKRTGKIDLKSDAKTMSFRVVFGVQDEISIEFLSF
jgi:hypothetical protein